MLRFLGVLAFLSGTVSGVCAPATWTCGSDAATPISTDRPQVTNSSIVVPCGSVQLENGLLVTGSGGGRILDLPESALRIGVARRSELRFGVPDYFHAGGGGSGFGDLSLGFKQQLGPVRKFDVSVIAAVSIPSGQGAYTSGAYDPAVQLPWSRSLSRNWTAAGMVSLSGPSDGLGHNVTGQPDLYFDRQLTAKWDAYAEYAGVFAQRGGAQNTIGPGTAYKLTPHQQVDVHAVFGVSAASPTYAVGVGYSFRLQAFRSR